MCGWAIGWERSVCWRPWGSPLCWPCSIGDAMPDSAECGTRNAELIARGSIPEARVGDRPGFAQFRTPHSALRIGLGEGVAGRGARGGRSRPGGFGDVAWPRRQDRGALYGRARAPPPPLVVRDDVVGAAERMGPAGVLEPLTDREVARVVAAVRALAPEAVAIALLFAFRDPTHERRLAGALRGALPGAPVAASHEVLPLFREFERTSTTTVEAYLRPKVSTYLERLEGGVRERGIGALRVMTSSGGTRAPAGAAAHAASLALSGPAGGVVGARLVGAAVGPPDLLPLDLGGTSARAGLVVGGAPAAHSG